MQNYTYQDNAGYAAPYQNNFWSPPDPKTVERRALRKTSNGLGFFVLVYFLMMLFSSSLVSLFIKAAGIATEENVVYLNTFKQIIYMVLSPLVAGFFYKLLSRKRISDYFPKSFVPLKKLIPLVLLGMGVAMIATQLAQMFDNNLSLFMLENSASMEENTSTALEMLMSFIVTAICPALAEEFAFRGIFMGVMRKYGDAFAILSSALMFGAMHGNTTQIVFAFTLGLVLGYVDCKANSIIPSILIHFMNNFYAVLSEFVKATVDETAYMVIFTALIGMFFLLGILSFVYFSRTDKYFFKLSNKDENRFSSTDILSFKEKVSAFLVNPGVIICLCLFSIEMITYLIPEEALKYLTGANFG